MASKWKADIEGIFPATKGTGADKTSDPTVDYNCIAHAVGEDDRWWSPGPSYYWPSSAPANMDFGSLVSAYESVGYVKCSDGNVESGYTKVALYIKSNGDWTHAAKQKEDGKWSSKLGRWIDIDHDDPADLNGLEYGVVSLFMKKPQ